MHEFTKRGRARRLSRLTVGVAGGAAFAVVASMAPAIAEVDTSEAAAYAGYICDGGFHGRGQHDLNFSLSGAPATFYVNEPAQVVNAAISYNLPANESSTFLSWALGGGWVRGWLTPTVDLSGDSVPGTEMESSKTAIQKPRTTLTFNGPIFTLPSQTTPRTIEVRIPQFSMPTYDWLVGGNAASLSPNPNYGCIAKPYDGQTDAPVLATYVVKSRSSVSLEVTPSSGVYTGTAGKAVATVGVDGGTVVGKVLFEVAGQTVEAVPNGLGVAEAALPANLPEGNNPVTATYVPDDEVHYDRSSTNGMIKVKAQTATTTAVSMPSTRLQPGEKGEATVLVTAAEGSPEGTVRLAIGDRAPLTATLEAGSASFELPSLAMGRHEVTATFAAVPGQHAGSVSTTSTITQLGSSSVVLETPTPVTDAENGSLKALVSAQGGATDGIVTFRVGGSAIEANVTDGVAMAAAPRLVAGTYPVVAEYRPAGGVDVVSSVSDGRDLLVTEVTSTPTPTPAPPTTPTPGPAPTTGPAASNLKLAVSQASVVYGTRARATAVVGRAAAGSVTFTVAGASTTVPVREGVASLDLPVLATGRYAVTATFAPTDAATWQAGSASTGLTVTRDTASAKVKVKVSKKKNAKARITIVATHGGPVNGTAKVVLSGKGVKKQKLTVAVRNGKAVAKFKNKLRVSTFKVAVKFRATADVAGAKGVALVKPKPKAKGKTRRILAGAAAGRTATSKAGLF